MTNAARRKWIIENNLMDLMYLLWHIRLVTITLKDYTWQLEQNASVQILLRLPINEMKPNHARSDRVVNEKSQENTNSLLMCC